MLEKFVNDQDVLLFRQQGWENLNLSFLECQITKLAMKGMNRNIELKRQNSQANRSVTYYKDSDTSLWQSQQN